MSIRKTILDTPEQNPYAERKNRTIIVTVRAILLDSFCPKELWPQAVLHAVYQRNRSQSKANAFEMFSGKKPKLKRLYMGQNWVQAWFSLGINRERIFYWI